MPGHSAGLRAGERARPAGDRRHARHAGRFARRPGEGRPGRLRLPSRHRAGERLERADEDLRGDLAAADAQPRRAPARHLPRARHHLASRRGASRGVPVAGRSAIPTRPRAACASTSRSATSCAARTCSRTTRAKRASHEDRRRIGPCGLSHEGRDAGLPARSRATRSRMSAPTIPIRSTFPTSPARSRPRSPRARPSAA